VENNSISSGKLCGRVPSIRPKCGPSITDTTMLITLPTSTIHKSAGQTDRSYVLVQYLFINNTLVAVENNVVKYFDKVTIAGVKKIREKNRKTTVMSSLNG
jgi:hypothetical protein